MICVSDAKLENLAQKLMKQLVKTNDFFVTKTIIFPNNKSINWFKSNWLKNNCSVLMNIKLVTIDQALLGLFDVSSSISLASKQQFVLTLIKIITRMYHTKVLPSIISDYIVENDTINNIKLYGFAESVAKLFIAYENDNFDMQDTWQKDLYIQLIDDFKARKLTTIYSLLRNNMPLKKQKIYVFGFSAFSKLQEAIWEKYDNVELYYLNKNNLELAQIKRHLQLVSAPSKVRELEFVHSEICKLILNNNQLMYNDFLVVAPQISEYETFIRQVFLQDGRDYVSIPYALSTTSNSHTDVYRIFATLVDIYKKGFYTRKDFATLVTNKLIMRSRNIAKEEAKAMLDAICYMRAYRNQDWDYLKKRLLLSKLIPLDDEFVGKLIDDNYIAFSSISLSDEVLVKFIAVIDDLESLLQVFKNNPTISLNNIDLIEKEIDKWFVTNDDDNYLCRPITSVFNNFKMLEVYDVDLDILLYAISSVTEMMKSINQDVFINGVSFVDFSDNAIYAAKYIFFVGANSHKLPFIELKNELDERPQIDNIDEQRDNFYLQLFNADERVYVSYQNLDLKTDETLYKTAFITKDIAPTIANPRVSFQETTLSIDENRDWAELFTKREMMNKFYLDNVLKSSEYDFKIDVLPTNEKPRKLDVKDIEDFLKEPLSYKASKLFGYVDNLDDELDDEYEPFEIDYLTRSIIIKKIIMFLIGKKDEMDNEVNTLEEKQELIDLFQLNHLLPTISPEIMLANFNQLYEKAKETVLFANKVAPRYQPVMIADVLIKTDNDSWLLTSKREVLKEEVENNVKYLEIRDLSKDDKYEENEDKMLRLYVISLMDIASKSPNIEYNVTLYRNDVMTVSYQLTPQEAISILGDCYRLMTDYADTKAMPMKWCLLTQKCDFNSYKQDLGDAWMYFKHKKMFNYNNDCGVKYNDFQEGNNFPEIKKARLELIAKIIKQTQNDGGDEVNG